MVAILYDQLHSNKHCASILSIMLELSTLQTIDFNNILVASSYEHLVMHLDAFNRKQYKSGYKLLLLQVKVGSANVHVMKIGIS